MNCSSLYMEPHPPSASQASSTTLTRFRRALKHVGEVSTLVTGSRVLELMADDNTVIRHRGARGNKEFGGQRRTTQGVGVGGTNKRERIGGMSTDACSSSETWQSPQTICPSNSCKPLCNQRAAERQSTRDSRGFPTYWQPQTLNTKRTTHMGLELSFQACAVGPRIWGLKSSPRHPLSGDSDIRERRFDEGLGSTAHV